MKICAFAVSSSASRIYKTEDGETVFSAEMDGKKILLHLGENAEKTSRVLT